MIFVSGVKDYKRLKSDETSRLSLNWNLNREISKLNYRIHTGAIKENLFPYELMAKQMSFTYADEAGSEGKNGTVKRTCNATVTNIGSSQYKQSFKNRR